MIRPGLPKRLAGDLRPALRAVAALVIGDARPLEAIAADARAVDRSFLALLPCLAIAALVHLADWRTAGHAPRPIWHAVAIDVAVFAIGWFGFLLLARAALGAFGGDGRRWPRLVVNWNWCNVSQYLVLLLATIVQVAGAGDFAIDVAGLVVLFWGSWIEYRALRPMLGTVPATLGLVALDILIGVASQVVAVGLGG